jgi:hypothetical protein
MVIQLHEEELKQKVESSLEELSEYFCDLGLTCTFTCSLFRLAKIFRDSGYIHPDIAEDIFEIMVSPSGLDHVIRKIGHGKNHIIRDASWIVRYVVPRGYRIEFYGRSEECEQLESKTNDEIVALLERYREEDIEKVRENWFSEYTVEDMMYLYDNLIWALENQGNRIRFSKENNIKEAIIRNITREPIVGLRFLCPRESEKYFGRKMDGYPIYSHNICVLGFDDKNIEYFDPYFGIKKYDKDFISSHIGGVFFIIEPDELIVKERV